MIILTPDAINTIRSVQSIPIMSRRENNATISSGMLINNIGLSLGYTVIRLDDESRDRFIAALDSPPQPNENIRRAIERRRR